MRSKHFFLALGVSSALSTTSACSAITTPPNDKHFSPSTRAVPLLAQNEVSPVETPKNSSVTTQVKGEPSQASEPPSVPSQPSESPSEKDSSDAKDSSQASDPASREATSTTRDSVSAEEKPATPAEATRREEVQSPPTEEMAPPQPRMDPVKNFLGDEVIQVLSKPDRVESYEVGNEPADKTIPNERKLDEFPVLKVGPKLKAEQMETFRKLVLDKSSYDFEKDKRSVFRPEVGLLFVKGDKELVVLVSFSRALWSFTYGKQAPRVEDVVNPARKQLEELFTKSLGLSLGNSAN